MYTSKLHDIGPTVHLQPLHVCFALNVKRGIPVPGLYGVVGLLKNKAI